MKLNAHQLVPLSESRSRYQICEVREREHNVVEDMEQRLQIVLGALDDVVETFFSTI